MKPDVNRAIESMIKYTIYLNIIFLIFLFFGIENFKLFSIVVLISNISILGLRQAIKKDAHKINERANRDGKISK